MTNTLKVFRNGVYILITLFLLNGCSSPDGNNTKDEAVVAEPLHKVDTVVVKMMKFTPAELEVRVGDTILWINNDLVDHNVTSSRDKFFYSDTLKVGKSWKWVVTDSAAYYCSIHPSMIGKILIKK